MASAGKRKRCDRLTLNVGGQRFESSVSTLAGASSYFSRLFSNEWSTAADERNSLSHGPGAVVDAPEYFLDRDPDAFGVLLSCMRYGSADPLPEDNDVLCKRVLLEAQYLGVDWLLQAVKAATHRNMHPAPPAGEPGTSAAAAEAAGTADATADASSAAALHGVAAALSDSEVAAAFDAEHGGLEGALRANVLPRRYFQRDAPRPSRPPGPTIRQLIPAGPTDTVFFNNDEDFQCRVVCYALVEQPSGATQVDAVIARGPEDDLDDGQQLQLASVYRREQQLATWAMRPVGEVTYTLERIPPPCLGMHPAESDGERRLLGVNEQAESGFVVRHVIPSPHETGACDVLMERTAPL